MTIAVIGADAESVHAIRMAKKQGHKIVAVDSNPRAEGLKEADVKLNIDISDEEKVIEALRLENIDMVLTAPIGRHLSTIGAVNDALGLPGISKKSALLCSDKYEFHNRLRNVRLRSGHCYLINSHSPLDPNQPNYPAIFKPRFGSHGRSVHYLTHADDLHQLEADIWGTEATIEEVQASVENRKPTMKWGVVVEEPEEKKDSKVEAEAFANKIKKTMEDRYRLADTQDDPNEDYILEEAFLGAEYAIDGVLEGCNFELCLMRRKILTNPPARMAVAYIALKQDEEPRLLALFREYMDKACEAMGLKDCMIHADICVLGRTCVAIEISASPAGRHVYDELLPMATGVDMCSQYLTYMAGEVHNFAPLNQKLMMLHYFDMEKCFIHKIPSEEEVKAALPENIRLRKWECNMKMLDYMSKITDEASLIGRGYYILEGNKESQLTDAAEIIKNLFEIK